MAVFEREVRVEAPFSDVWQFHSRASGLEALTPDWLRLRIESVRGPDGDPDPDVLDAGSEIVSSVRPLGVGPRVRWTSRIVEREADGTAGRFRDVMADGPMAEWEHTHSFFADGDETVVHDRVEYAFPPGRLGRAFSPLGVVGLEPMFRARHARTKAELE